MSKMFDITVFDPDRSWVFRRNETFSKSTNNPFYDWPLRGMTIFTIVAGRVVYDDKKQPVPERSLA